MCFCVVTAFSGTSLAAEGYYAGEYLKTLDFSYGNVIENAEITASGIDIKGGGSVEFDFLLPFNSSNLIVTYASSTNGNLVYESAVNSVKTAFLKESSECMVAFNITERSGEQSFILGADTDITITKLVFEKEKISVPDKKLLVPDMTENEKLVAASVIISKNASAIVVNGAKRYINNDNASEKPFMYENRIYLPAHTLARALGYYIEELPEKNYIFLRHEDVEFCFSDSVNYVQKNGGNKEAIQSPVIYKEGKAFLPIRYFAEILGKTVGYKDGVVVIDNLYNVKSILDSESNFKYLNELLSPFTKEAVSGSVYYVAQTENADDSNEGSYLKPFKTLEKAATVAQAGDTVIIKEGVYRETLTPKNNGTPTSPIIFKAAEGEKVVLSAAEEVSGIAHYKDNIYTAYVDWDLGYTRNQIYMDGEGFRDARYPNEEPVSTGENGTPVLSRYFPTFGDMYTSADNSTVVYSGTELNQEDDYWKGGTFVALKGAGYTLSTARIESSTKGQLNLTNTSKQFWWNADTIRPNKGYIAGHINALDIPYEFVLQNNTVYFIPPEDADVNNMKIEVKKRQLVADLSNSKYIHIKGVETLGGSMKMNRAEMCVLDKIDAKYISHFTFNHDPRDGFIDDGNVYNPDGAPSRGEVGIYIGGSDNVVINSKFDHSAASALYLVGKYTYIENNIISNCGYMGTYVSGINIETEPWEPYTVQRGGLTIIGNTLYNAGRSVINVGSDHSSWSTGIVPFLPCEIAYNDMHDGTLFSRDSGIIYECSAVMGFDWLKTKLHHNLIYYNLNDVKQMSAGIYHDGYTEGIDTYKNVIFTTQPDGAFEFNEVFRQPDHATGAAICAVWNNSGYKSLAGGVSNLKANDYPDGKIFYAGSKLEETDYTPNYDIEVLKSEENKTYYANEAVLHNGATLENGALKLTSEEQYAEFKGVDFGEKNNVVKVSFLGDKYNTGEEIEIGIGDTYETALKSTFVLKADSPYLNSTSLLEAIIAPYSGKQNVYIKLNAHKSSKITGITTSAYYTEIDNLENLSGIFYAGNFTEIVQYKNPVSPQPVYQITGDRLHSYVNNTWPGAITRYKGVILTDTATKVNISAASKGQHSGQVVRLRIGSPTSEPILTYTVPNNGWEAYDPVEVKLDAPLEAGSYDFYLTFEDNADGAGQGTSNFAYIAFLK